MPSSMRFLFFFFKSDLNFAIVELFYHHTGRCVVSIYNDGNLKLGYKWATNIQRPSAQNE